MEKVKQEGRTAISPRISVLQNRALGRESFVLLLLIASHGSCCSYQNDLSAGFGKHK